MIYFRWIHSTKCKKIIYTIDRLKIVVSNLIAYLANQVLQLMLSIRNFYWPLNLPQFKVYEK